MRVAVISDIHGNQVALEAVLQDISQQPAIDFMAILGDLCLNGPQPRQVLEVLQGLGCPVVQGNVDVDVVEKRGKKGTKKRDIIEWTRKQIGPEGISYLASLPFSHIIPNPDGSDVMAVHANPLNQKEAIFPTSPDSMLEHLLAHVEPTIGAIAFGHLHIAYQRRWQHLLLLDAGSCGLPRDEDLRASYGILTCQDAAWHSEHRRVEYDVEKVVHQLETCGMPHAEKRIRILKEASYT